MRILVTRPEDDAAAFAALLKARGHEAVLAPLLSIRLIGESEIDLDGVQAILATSANGIRALARRSVRRDVAVFAVGPQTAEAAKTLGYTNVKNAGGDAKKMVVATQDWAKPDDGALLHAAGLHTQGALAAGLGKHGFDVRSAVLYEAVAAEELPHSVVLALREHKIQAVAHFSPRSARIFRECVTKARAKSACAGLTALCISQAAADALAPLKFRAVRVAKSPDQDAVLALLD
ncbi:MAG TPA: uroporphyrinogen-III synthase [Rhizomicrobium sp.]|nr:uroporphyrinogen-III synthase [Rhizomicrobium sp.]